MILVLRIGGWSAGESGDAGRKTRRWGRSGALDEFDLVAFGGIDEGDKAAGGGLGGAIGEGVTEGGAVGGERWEVFDLEGEMSEVWTDGDGA